MSNALSEFKKVKLCVWFRKDHQVHFAFQTQLVVVAAWCSQDGPATEAVGLVAPWFAQCSPCAITRYPGTVFRSLYTWYSAILS